MFSGGCGSGPNVRIWTGKVCPHVDTPQKVENLFHTYYDKK